MEKQVIISIGREFGSGGHVIAEALAKHYSIPLYDYNLLHEIAAQKNVDGNELAKYDEVPRNIFFHRNVNGYHNSPAVQIAEMQFDYLRKKAENGESFVIVGRCAEHILKDNPCLISIFILGDYEAKVQRIMELHSLKRESAEQMIRYKDRKRKTYHNFYCDHKWGDSRNYDITINSSCLGIDETTTFLIDYIDKRYETM